MKVGQVLGPCVGKVNGSLVTETRHIVRLQLGNFEPRESVLRVAQFPL